MTRSALQAVVSALNRRKVRYMVVGGLAAVAHGVNRMTFDVDLLVQLRPENVKKAFAALSEAGYQPRVPVTGEQFADEKLRERWIEEKGMVVLRFWSDEHPTTDVDVFVREPFGFDEGYATALQDELPGHEPIWFVGRDLLMEMKRKAGRPKDLEDIRNLGVFDSE